ncbi:uncharacterized protein F5891DRAFT_1191247 [Suillus fuscotomentosus]|uniref:Uncharacterized protein n=1 Tax=Suillus fuscotomentosus TaxID=1912939 RepID=A0AAD4E1F8_9AGAM|nr:uncharacterized protein F5891DRAFT_1191247 [Suillus fuscotomentosus]KAG1897936.1 hypothetical protein F5891DRAFT_1191247 [Suillus fuscotomentosus]
MPAGRPVIYTTPEAKCAAEREKCHNYYARNKVSINLKCQLAACCTPTTRQADSQATDSLGSGVLHDLSPAPDTLSDCLGIVREAKDELITLAATPVAYVEHILRQYVASVSNDSDGEALTDRRDGGDISIIKDAIQTIENIHKKAHHGQDKIWDMCGVCDEWRAADEVCRAIRRLLEYLQDILWHLELSYGELACAFVAKELMYQNDDTLY